MRKFPVLTSSAIVLLALAGCGSPEQELSPPGGSPSTEATAGPSASPDTSVTAGTAVPSEDAITPSGTTVPDEDAGSASPSDESTSSSDTSDEPSDDESSPGAAVLSPEKKGQTLALADFFNPGSAWTENRYDVADQGSVSGIATEIGGCGSSYTPKPLELRLANNFATLKFKVGQANSSESSDQILGVRVEGNGKQIDVQQVPFNEIQDFSVKVEDVNALKLQFYLDEEGEHCGSGAVQAVMYDVELQ